MTQTGIAKGQRERRPPTPLAVPPPDHETAVKAFVSISPFSYAAMDEHPGGPSVPEVEATLSAHVGRDHALTNSGRHALRLILAHLGLRRDDIVTIVTTSGGNYVSGCVTRAISDYCGWSMNMEPRTAAVLVIHEWGRACERIGDYLGLGLPVIEDCAYAFATRYADGEPVGRRGDYALYSLTKMFSVNFGGIVAGPGGQSLGFTMPSAERDFLLGRIGPELCALDRVLSARRAVWNALATRFSTIGADPFFDPVAGEEPAVYMFRHDGTKLPFDEVRRRFDAHGIEASALWGSDAFYVPAHHRIGPATRELMFRLYEGLLAEREAEPC